MLSRESNPYEENIKPTGLEYIQSTGHTSTHAPSVTSTHALPII